MTKIKIHRNKEKIINLLNENIDLEYKLSLKFFKRFSEEVRNIGTKKEPNNVNIKLGHWFEWFFDEDYPNDKKHAVKIERSQIVEIDGEKSDHWNKIKYFKIEDI